MRRMLGKLFIWAGRRLTLTGANLLKRYVVFCGGAVDSSILTDVEGLTEDFFRNLDALREKADAIRKKQAGNI